MPNADAKKKPGEDILHVTVIGVYHMTQDELADTLERLAKEARAGGINNSQPGDIAVVRSNPGGGGPCAPQQISVDVSLVPARVWPRENGFAQGVPGL